MKTNMRSLYFSLLLILSVFSFQSATAGCPTGGFGLKYTMNSGCLPVAGVTFQAFGLSSIIPAPTSVCWNLDDGGGINCTGVGIATAAYTTAGPKNIILRVQLVDGSVCFDSIALNVKAYPNPAFDTITSANSTGNKSCGTPINKTFKLQDQALASSTWEIRNSAGNKIYGPITKNTNNHSISYTFPSNDTAYTIKVVVFDTTGCVKDTSITYKFYVTGSVTGLFTTTSPSRTCTPVTYTFNPNFNIPAGVSLSSAEWTVTNLFDNSSQTFTKTSPATAPLALPTFNSAGKYTIALKVKANGCDFTIGAPQTIEFEPQPALNFTLNGSRSPISVCMNQLFEVKNTSVIPATSTPSQYTFSFYNYNSALIPSKQYNSSIRPVASGNGPTGGVNYKYNVATSGAGINSVILKYSGACPNQDTLKDVITVKAPLAAIALMAPFLPLDCDAPYIFKLNDGTAFKSPSANYEYKWTIFGSNGTFKIKDTITPTNILQDTLLVFGDKKFYQLKISEIISPGVYGCVDSTAKQPVQIAFPTAEFINLIDPATNQPTDTIPLTGCATASSPSVQYNPKDFIADPGIKFFYKIEILDPTNPNNVIASQGPSNYAGINPMDLTVGGIYKVRQIIGLNSTMSKCLDTAYMSVIVKSFTASADSLNPVASCLTFNKTTGTWERTAKFGVKINLSTSYPTTQSGFSYVWTVNGSFSLPPSIKTPTSQSTLATFYENGAYGMNCNITTSEGCVVDIPSNYLVGTKATISAPTNAGDTLVACINNPITSILASGFQGSSFTYRWDVVSATGTGHGNTAIAGKVLIANGNSFNPTVTLTDTLPYYLRLYVTNDSGCVDSAYLKVKGIKFRARIQEKIGIVGDTVNYACPGYTFFNNATDNITDFEWTVIDPNLGRPGDTVVTFVATAPPNNSTLFNFTYPGIKTVILKANSIYGCSAYDTLYVVFGGPRPRFDVVTPSSRQGCDSLKVVMVDKSANVGKSSFVFLWGDGGFDYQFADTNRHVYKYSYPVKNTVTDTFRPILYIFGEGCQVSFTDSFTIFPRPVVSGFINGKDSICAPASFTFNDTSRFAPIGNYGYWSNNTLFSWNYGDGSNWDTTTVSKTKTKIYSVPGTYQVKLAIKNPWGCIDTANFKKVIAVDTPVAGFMVNKTIECWLNGNNGFVFTDTSRYGTTPARVRQWFWNDPSAVPASGVIKPGAVTGNVNFNIPGSSTPQSYTISLKVTNKFGCSDSIGKTNFITVRDTVSPAPISPTYVTVDPTTLKDSIQINWNATNISNFYAYNLYRNNVLTKSLTNQALNSYWDVVNTVSSPSPYTYYIKVADQCFKESPLSTIHSSIKLDVQSVASTGGLGSNMLTFNAYTGWGDQATNIDKYEVYRKNPKSAYNLVGTVSPISGATTYQFEDKGLCSDVYTYYVKALNKNFTDPRYGYYSLSNYDEEIATFNVIVTPVEVNYVTVDSINKITVKWTDAPVTAGVLKQYIVEKTSNTNPVPSIVYRGTATTFDDYNVNPSAEIYQYTVRYEDNCGNLSNLSDTSNNILLATNAVAIAGYTDAWNVGLSWNHYKTWKNGVIRYDIDVKYPQGWVTVGSVPGTDNVFVDSDVPRNGITGAYCYRIKAIENDAVADSSISNESCVIYPSKILVPPYVPGKLAFSPNNDGLNDTLFILGSGLKTYSFKVFDRWGKCVFSTEDINLGWNGKFQNTGNPCESGMYSYSIIAKGQDFRRFNLKGTITLLK